MTPSLTSAPLSPGGAPFWSRREWVPGRAGQVSTALRFWQLKSCLCLAAGSHEGHREAVLPHHILLPGDSHPVLMAPCAPAAHASQPAMPQEHCLCHRTTRPVCPAIPMVFGPVWCLHLTCHLGMLLNVIPEWFWGTEGLRDWMEAGSY